ncbi:hypothetical protein HETIRDRAFT_448489 [Heterobasidion irregulare TC 32-1]|uniref:Uncharacterized protein n=1 Tax=Heterobasidion irregulare (strain TC 32-1) TaxID=747525 RepID=W4KHR2_HETIT|nr:uncharacterized protein HETIRDRAFT_448489 [Heterobasidion irregulare TC 32-1]ETW85372.1 hypothetical protein HETIRDRAFT_448489 [Heterobasidion irregulare TC 32-1]
MSPLPSRPPAHALSEHGGLRNEQRKHPPPPPLSQNRTETARTSDNLPSTARAPRGPLKDRRWKPPPLHERHSSAQGHTHGKCLRLEQPFHRASHPFRSPARLAPRPPGLACTRRALASSRQPRDRDSAASPSPTNPSEDPSDAASTHRRAASTPQSVTYAHPIEQQRLRSAAVPLGARGVPRSKLGCSAPRTRAHRAPPGPASPSTVRPPRQCSTPKGPPRPTSELLAP